jgi:hypothetical protein
MRRSSEAVMPSRELDAMRTAGCVVRVRNHIPRVSLPPLSNGSEMLWRLEELKLREKTPTRERLLRRGARTRMPLFPSPLESRAVREPSDSKLSRMIWLERKFARRAGESVAGTGVLRMVVAFGIVEVANSELDVDEIDEAIVEVREVIVVRKGMVVGFAEGKGVKALDNDEAGGTLEALKEATSKAAVGGVVRRLDTLPAAEPGTTPGRRVGGGEASPIVVSPMVMVGGSFEES